jgi:hypothetical protein
MILLTGATGHVGRAVVSRLASLGHDVVAMVRRPGRKQAPAIRNRPARCGLRGCLSFAEGARATLWCTPQGNIELMPKKSAPIWLAPGLHHSMSTVAVMPALLGGAVVAWPLAARAF